jgi:hypothetical protein
MSVFSESSAFNRYDCCQNHAKRTQRVKGVYTILSERW